MSFLILICGLLSSALFWHCRKKTHALGLRFASIAMTLFTLGLAAWQILHDPDDDPQSYLRQESLIQQGGFQLLANHVLKEMKSRPLRITLLTPPDGAPLPPAMVQDLKASFGRDAVFTEHCSSDMLDPESMRSVSVAFNCDLVLCSGLFDRPEDLETLFADGAELPRFALFYSGIPAERLQPWLNQGAIICSLRFRAGFQPSGPAFSSSPEAAASCFELLCRKP